MKQNKGRSFASLAKSLDARYSNRKNDRMLEEEYHNEMQKLVQQQEAARAQMGLTNDNGQDRMMPDQNAPQQFKKGSYLPNKSNVSNVLNYVNPTQDLENPEKLYDFLNPIEKINPIGIDSSIRTPKYSPYDRDVLSKYGEKMTAKGNSDLKEYNNPFGFNDAKKTVLNSYVAPISLRGANDMKLISPIESISAPKQGLVMDDSMKSKLANQSKPVTGVGEGNKSDLTNSYISAGATALNNILQGVLTKKPKSIAAPSYTPKELDLSNRVLEAKRQAELSSNVARNQARNLGLNAGATIANQAGAQSGIDRNLAGVLTDINLAEQQYNVGEQNKAGMFNAEAKYKNDLINQQLKDQYDQKMLNSLSGTIGTIPELMTDVNKIKYQDKVLAGLDTKEKNIIKLLSSGKFKYDSDEFKIMYDSLSDNAKKQITK